MKVGDYVRTEKGIAKIIGKLDKMRISYPEAWVTDTYLGIYDDTEYIYDEAVIKSSPNIIDLIQENDYINGLRVEKNKYGDLYTSYTYMGGLVGTQEETYTTFLKDYENDYIQTIVTKEQFKDMEYEVK